MMSRFEGERTPDSGLVVGKPRFLDDVRRSLRVRHYSRRTERAYVQWIPPVSGWFSPVGRLLFPADRRGGSRRGGRRSMGGKSTR